MSILDKIKKILPKRKEPELKNNVPKEKENIRKTFAAYCNANHQSRHGRRKTLSEVYRTFDASYVENSALSLWNWKTALRPLRNFLLGRRCYKKFPRNYAGRQKKNAPFASSASRSPQTGKHGNGIRENATR